MNIRLHPILAVTTSMLGEQGQRWLAVCYHVLTHHSFPARICLEYGVLMRRSSISHGVLERIIGKNWPAHTRRTNDGDDGSHDPPT